MTIQENKTQEILQKYEDKSSYLKYVAKDNPKDCIELEIGDSKDLEKFQPQIKLMRWDNEVNVSFRLLGDEFENKTPVEENSKLKISGLTKEINLYTIEPSGDLPDGGYEFELILKEKPESNISTFSMQTKGLEFFYQPELTDYEIKDGCKRPENVVGSYAIYYKNCPPNYEGGKEYKNGKAFHIYRPRVEDAEGNWTWGVLNIENDTLTVTIPQEFLDTAVYPVKHATGLTFGYTSIGGSDIEISDRISGSMFSCVTGSCSTVTVYLPGTAGGPEVNVAIYRYNLTNNPLIEQATSQYITYADPGQWVDFSLDSTVSVSLGTYYVLVCWGESTTVAYAAYDKGDWSSQGQYGSETYSSSFPSTTSFTAEDKKYSIYTTYTAYDKTVAAKANIIKNYYPACELTVSGSYADNLDSATRMSSSRFTCDKTGTIKAIVLRLYFEGTCPNYTFSIQADDNGNPSGTPLASLTAYITSSNLYTIGLGNTVNVTKGEIYHIVVEYHSLTIDSGNYMGVGYIKYLDYRNWIDNSWNGGLAYLQSFDSGSTWPALTNRGPRCAIEYSDDEIRGNPIYSNSSYNTYGAIYLSQKLLMPSTGAIISSIGFFCYKIGSPADTLQYEIRDVDDSDSLIDSGVLASSVNVTTDTDAEWLDVVLDPHVRLDPTHTYRLVLKSPSSADSDNCYYVKRLYTINNAAYIATTFWGSDATYASSSDSGANYTDYTFRDLSFRCTLENYVYAKTTTAKANITGDVEPLEINVYNSTTATDEPFANKNSENIYTYDDTDITDIASAEIPILHISVNDQTTVTDDASTEAGELYISVHDATAITDTADVSIPTLTIAVYSSSSVTEYSNVLSPTLTISVNDSPTATDASVVQASASLLTTYDSSTITDNVLLETSAFQINVNDGTSATDGTNVHITTLHIYVNDQSSVIDVPNFSGTLVIYEYENVSVTDEIIIKRSEEDLSVYDSVTVTEYLDTNKNFETINVNDSTSVTDYSSINKSSVNISVGDITTVTDVAYASKDSENISVYDGTVVIDIIATSIPALNVSVYEESTITYNINANITTLHISVYEQSSVSDNSNISTSALLINISDNASVYDWITDQIPSLSIYAYENVVVIGIPLFSGTFVIYEYETVAVTDGVAIRKNVEDTIVSDQSGVTDAVSMFVPILHVSTYDSSSITDTTTVSKDTIHIEVYDESAVTETATNETPTLPINVYDSTSVTDAIGGADIPTLHIYSYDESAVYSWITDQIPTLSINVYDSSTVTEWALLSTTGFGIFVADNSDITDTAAVVIPTVYIAVSDSSEITDEIYVETSALLINENDTSGVTDYNNELIPSANINVYDSTNVTESTTAVIPLLHIYEYENSAVTDITSVRITTLFINEYDSSTISEATSIERIIPNNVDVYEESGVTDISSVVIPKLHINVHDITTVTDYATIFPIPTATVDAKGSIKKTTTHTVNSTANILTTAAITVSAIGNITKTTTQTVTATANIRRITVVEIVDKYRKEDLVKNVTYVKEMAKEIKSVNVRVNEIKNNFTNVTEIAYNRVDVISVAVPKVVQTKWATAKAHITT